MCQPELKPEYAYTADLGEPVFWSADFFVQLNLFYTLLYNYIARQPYMLPFDDSSISFDTVTHLGDELETWAIRMWEKQPSAAPVYSGTPSFTRI